tara:strand:- start:1382 stop:1954 length:573 start_codon:yes stop_codon:yes gene_type:complete
MTTLDEPLNLKGKFLVAMPGMGDQRFESSVIYICDHTETGAMGLIVNKPLRQGSFKDLCEQLSIKYTSGRDVPILFGGPVETSRGFAIHSNDYLSENSTQFIGDSLSLTSTRDVIEALADGETPSHAGLFLGYSGWGAGQLEAEILHNGWLTVDADEALVLDSDHARKWQAALDLLGINALLLSSDVGHA